MGRGRQKAKQQKIARKLKYLTTDTDYDELAKELNTHEPGQGSFDPFESDNYDESKDYLDKEEDSSDFADDSDSKDANEEQDSCDSVPCNDDDLDDYAKWAAEAAASAANKDKSSGNSGTIHHHIPMPMPNFMHKK
ncbi:DUF3073 domain-containing protein [Gardnerella vaginalis]|uniref:DUF3073 domain-containing protein n=1 Tax=Gardnerella vaginalis TaxID=2702 RepID=UPI00200DED54|nr:DUF3073 domain-containing protein [Gardnerella vaginalis]MDK7259895.1 DUF3073 domain-containing protein [Gardnerella vaginalis]MDK8776660.1 DUF3073 domain-containing protein [Gardnerella vaginalis]UQA85512.1 DUF3073 domain-containing protein [Gardnerella vaginalis]